MRKQGHASALLPFFLLVPLCALLLCNAQSAAQGIRRGLTLCAETLIPALFPFLVLSELIVASGLGKPIERFLGRPLCAFLGLSRCGAASLLLGLLCGQPIATTAALTYLENGEMSKEELRRVSLFGNNPSNGFLVGAVGTALFGNQAAGIALFCITTLSALLVGAGVRFWYGKSALNTKKPPNGARKALCPTDITRSIKRAFFTLLQICAFLLFFCALGSSLCDILAKYGVPPIVRVLVFGCLEITCGITHATATLPALVAFRCTAFFAGFAGLSVCLQIFSIAEGHGLRLFPYLICKSAQGILNLLFCEVYLRLFKPSFTLTQSTPAFGSSVNAFPWATALFFVFLALVIFDRLKKTKKGT